MEDNFKIAKLSESYTLSIKAFSAKLESWGTYLDFQKYSVEEDAQLFEAFSELTHKIKTAQKALKLYLFCLFNKIQKNKITKEQVLQAFEDITIALNNIPQSCKIKSSYSIPAYQETIEKLLSDPDAINEAKDSMKISRADFIEDYFK